MSSQAGRGRQGDACALWQAPLGPGRGEAETHYRPPACGLPPGPPAHSTSQLRVGADTSLWLLLRKPGPTSGKTQGRGGAARGPGVRGLPRLQFSGPLPPEGTGAPPHPQQAPRT